MDFLDPDRQTPGWRWQDLILFIPLLGAIAFVAKFAGPLPLTDEWGYSHALRQLSGVDLTSWSGWQEIVRLWPTKHSEHVVALPFAVYWPVAIWADFDSRWITGLTLLAFALQVWVLRRHLVFHPLLAALVALVVFAPSHYMEFLWGWQLTITLSITLPMLGLVQLSQTADDTSPASKFARDLVVGLLLILAGTLSSAGGFFGFAAGLVLLGLQPMSLRRREVAMVTTVIVAVVVYFTLMSTRNTDWSFGMRDVWYVLTTVGAGLWGSPVGLTEFSLDFRSAGGLFLLVAVGFCFGRSVITKQWRTLALPLSWVAFGLVCMVPIALARPYLGNWHVQHILPTIAGALAVAWVMWQKDRTKWSAVPLLVIAGLLASGLYGWVRGFGYYGPDYAKYIGSIEAHAFRYLENENSVPPYPPQNPAKDLDAPLMLFLAAHQHPLFSDLLHSELSPENNGEVEVLVDGQTWEAAATHAEEKSRLRWVVVRSPRDSDAAGGWLEFEEHRYRLWRLAPAHVPEHSRQDDKVHFAATLLPQDWQAGVALPRVTLFR